MSILKRFTKSLSRGDGTNTSIECQEQAAGRQRDSRVDESPEGLFGGTFIRPLVVGLGGVMLLGWVALMVDASRFADISGENGLVESFGTLGFLVAAIVFFFSARRLGTERAAPRRRARVAMSTFLGLVFLLAFLEEISWGQQLFSWGTPDSFDSNLQSETNLHNFSRFDCHMGCTGTFILRGPDGQIVFDLQRGFTMGILALALMVPIAARGPRQIRRLLAGFGIPVVSITIGGWAVLNFLVSRIALKSVSPTFDWIVREYMESMWGMVALLVAVASLPTIETFYSSSSD